MDGDTKLIENWLKDSCNNQSAKLPIPSKDVVEAIYSLIDDWKCNKEVRRNCYALKNFSTTQFVFVGDPKTMPSDFWILSCRTS